ncbi:DUF2508 family protein [Paenibacillus sp. YN15]|uniref:DUF2508 family protein n=1 Tax=Paenibacillus sp. YN15 TaxID=1742774 RepID=UPI0015EB985D|nr:DUF2508 family protein [Paenibacillus sp. YN15]
MRWLPKWKVNVQMRMEEPAFLDKVGMHREIRKAHLEWTTAHQRLEWVVEKDQIDYAIYALEAAEKRYIMLLRQAKLMQWEDGLLVATQAQRLHSPEGKGSGTSKRNGGQAASS